METNISMNEAITIVNEKSNDLDKLKSINIKNKNRLIIAQLNINSLRNKFDCLEVLIKDKIDILVITETKLDDTFPLTQFSMEGFKTPIRQDRSCHGGGISVYIRDNIPSKVLQKLPFDCDNEGIFLELNLRKSKWLLFAGYNPKKERISPYLNNVETVLSKFIKNYDNIIIMGDFNCDMKNLENNPLLDFCETYSLKNIVNAPTCYKNPSSPTTIDVILTNRKESFCDVTVIETGLSDFHKMTVTCLKRYFKKLPPKTVFYRDYKHFDVNLFRNALLNDLLPIQHDDISYDDIKDILISKLDIYAPIKTRLVRANDAPYMNTALRKSIMTRSRLKNKYTKNPTAENLRKYKKQRNYCVNLVKKSKKEYYRSVNTKIVSETFGKILNHSFPRNTKNSVK